MVFRVTTWFFAFLWSINTQTVINALARTLEIPGFLCHEILPKWIDEFYFWFFFPSHFRFSLSTLDLESPIVRIPFGIEKKHRKRNSCLNKKRRKKTEWKNVENNSSNRLIVFVGPFGNSLLCFIVPHKVRWTLLNAGKSVCLSIKK